MTKSLDLGCGDKPKNLFNATEVFGVDIRDIDNARIKKADLATEAIPFESDYFDFVTAHDFIEHIPRLIYAPHRRNSFVELMNEVYRVLKPEGIFASITPAYPHAPAFRDPTHVNIITEETFQLYFDDKHIWAQMYGFRGAFTILQQTWSGASLVTLMKKTLQKVSETN